MAGKRLHLLLIKNLHWDKNAEPDQREDPVSQFHNGAEGACTRDSESHRHGKRIFRPHHRAV